MTPLQRSLLVPIIDSVHESASDIRSAKSDGTPQTHARVALSAVALVEALMDVVSYGQIVLDADARVVLWSAWLEKVSGISTEAALGRTLLENFPELAGSRVQGAVDSALQDGFPSILSQSLNRSPFPLFAKISPTGPKQRIQQKINVLPLLKNQSPPCCLIEIFDVSLAVHREKTINEQKKFLNTILDSEPECVMVLAADGSVIQMNPAGLALFEVENLDELRQHGLLNFVLPAHQATFSAMVQRVFAGEHDRFEFKIEGRRGTRCWLDTNATPLRDAKGTVISMLAVGRDTTARRQAEATTRALIDATQESAFLLDREGGILAINEVAARRLGKTSGELSGRNFFALLPPDVAAARQAIAEKVFSTGKPANLQDVRNGIHFGINVYPVFDNAAKVVSIAVYATDVTETLQQSGVDRLFHQIDQQILHGHARQNLFQFICAEVARIFDYPFVWIGRKGANGTLTVAAWGGTEETYFSRLDAVGVRWDNTPLGQGPAGKATRSGQTQKVRGDAPEFAPWRTAAADHNLHACYSIPLILRGEVFGCFTLASSRDNTFDNPATVQRLADIASRICVAQERANDHEQLLLLQTALSTAANGVFITDKFGHIQWLNAAFITMTGYSEEEAIGATPRLLRIGTGDESLFEDLLASIGEGEAWNGETVERRKDGSKFSVRQTITPIRDANGETTHFISILEDITATREAEATIKHLAHYDVLTELPNRVLFNEYFRQAVALAKRSGDMLALMFIDLDHFKQVNDSHGHNIGDLLLQQVASRLKATVRESDTVSRLAGDEFTVLLPAVTTPTDAALVAEKLTAAFAKPFDIEGMDMQSGISIGIAVFPTDADNEAALLKCADLAMYAAKRAGRNRYCQFQPAMISEPQPD